MVRCAVVNCKNYENLKSCVVKLKFFTFPKDKSLCDKWIRACGCKRGFNVHGAKICSDHFLEQDYRLQDILLNTEYEKKKLKKGAIPSQNLLVSNGDVSAREGRINKRERKQIVHQAVSEYEQNERDQKELESSGQVLLSLEIDTINNVAVQTESNLKSCLEMENAILKSQLRKEKNKRRTCELQLEEANKISNGVTKIFTKGQIKKLKNPQVKVRWCPDDITNAISLYSAGAKAYRLLRSRGYPLPSVSILKMWAAKLKLNIGLVNN